MWFYDIHDKTESKHITSNIHIHKKENGIVVKEYETFEINFWTRLQTS